MTVAELIEVLSRQESDAEVLVYDYGWLDNREIEEIRIHDDGSVIIFGGDFHISDE